MGELDDLLADLDGVEVVDASAQKGIEIASDDLDALMSSLAEPEEPAAAPLLLPASQSSRRKKHSANLTAKDSLTLRAANEDASNSSTHSLCARCAKEVVGAATTVGTRRYHPECFVCGGCSVTLKGEFRVLDPSEASNGITVRCEECYAKVFSCGTCSGKIDGKYFTREGVRYHPDCVPNLKTCAKCGEQLTGKLIAALDKLWHPECLVCVQCSSPVATSFYKDPEGNPVCPKCNGEAPVDGMPTCVVCNKGFDGEFFKLADKYYHRPCFKCHFCQAALEDVQFYNVGEAHACLDCARKHQ